MEAGNRPLAMSHDNDMSYEEENLSTEEDGIPEEEDMLCDDIFLALTIKSCGLSSDWHQGGLMSEWGKIQEDLRDCCAFVSLIRQWYIADVAFRCFCLIGWS
jgi:hypothetical protein